MGVGTAQFADHQFSSTLLEYDYRQTESALHLQPALWFMSLFKRIVAEGNVVLLTLSPQTINSILDTAEFHSDLELLWTHELLP